MGVFEWKDSFSVGVELIDEQHKMLIKSINDITDAVNDNKGSAVVARTLNFLIEYTDFHFSLEEKHMSEHNYPEIEDHLKRHEEFKNTLANLEKDFREDGATHILAESIDTFMINWLTHHITSIDVKLASFFKEKNITVSV